MSDIDSKQVDYSQLLTLYGRNPVLEALQDNSLTLFRLHLSTGNKRSEIISDIESLAKQRNVDIRYHQPQALSRISKNAKQDQGVALDVQPQGSGSWQQWLSEIGRRPMQILALDGITNPQNLGLIIRSVAASGFSGLILPKQGCASISPLVIKASAGTLFKAAIAHCPSLQPALVEAQQRGAKIAILDGRAEQNLFEFQKQSAQLKQSNQTIIYVLGNETEGVSQAVKQLADTRLSIPMHNGVESLNVAVTAGLIVFAQEAFSGEAVSTEGFC